MPNITPSQIQIKDMLLVMLKSNVQKDMEKEIEEAKARLEESLKAQVDTMALKILKNYSVQMNQGEILIRVQDFRGKA